MQLLKAIQLGMSFSLVGLARARPSEQGEFAAELLDDTGRTHSLHMPVATRDAESLCPTPAHLPTFNNSKLPNPFIFDDGRPVRTVADWDCRRAQLSTLIQSYESGLLPGPPQSMFVHFNKTGNATATLSITSYHQGASMTFAPTIAFPSGNPPRSGWPLVIAYDGNSDMAQQNDQSSRGVGLFYDLFGANASASSMVAWTWGVSRIIDALERTPQAQINTNKIAVTGCSRNGKGALMAGAFEPRVALTIPQESGSGGDACWRLSLYEQDQGSVVQTATEIVQENVWFSTDFANYVNDLSVLPFDHHSLAAMIAPRPMISYENTDFVWLSPLSSFGCMSAAHTVWEALGVADHHGFEQVGGHPHCAWPDSLSPTLNAFFNRFLLDQPHVNTTFFQSNMVFNNVTWNPEQWIDWKTPRLA
ncbi:Carbohydrate Esterase Family 15 protein [Trametes cinnabarina]|uniref:(4-O-methyl)-D-glucuronate--lignin esterase n=1 Tax=Pycnoporus cinnabarinus TaxID=5643 RepID=A0A060S7B6_PYCCI|nr:Carbohydrate Esterase Family 15 protein [Trametes cinnabarina]